MKVQEAGELWNKRRDSAFAFPVTSQGNRRSEAGHGVFSAVQCKVWEFPSFRKTAYTGGDCRAFSRDYQPRRVANVGIRRPIARDVLVERPIVTLAPSYSGRGLKLS